MEKDDLLAELEKTLRKFKIDDLKVYAMRDLPETSWESMKRLLGDNSENINTRKVAAALTRLVSESKPQWKDLENRLELLRIKAIGLSSTRTWYSYELLKSAHKEYDEDEQPGDLPAIARLVGRALGIRVRAVRGQNGGTWLSLGHGKRLTVASVHFNRRCLLLSTKVDNMDKLHDIARGLGYCGSKDLHLSGRHVPSLLRMIDARRGAANCKVVVQPSLNSQIHNDFTPQLTSLGLGLDFTHRIDHDNLFPTLDDEFDNCNVKLQTLTVRARGSERGSAKSTCVITSCDVVKSLSNMLDHGFIDEDSPFLKMVNDKGKNDILIEVGAD